MGAEDGGWIETVAAGVAPGGGGGLVWQSEDLGGDVVGLSGVVLADAGGHEEALEETEDRGDAVASAGEIALTLFLTKITVNCDQFGLHQPSHRDQWNWIPKGTHTLSPTYVSPA